MATTPTITYGGSVLGQACDRQPYGLTVADRLRELAMEADQLADRLAAKLSPIVMPSSPPSLACSKVAGTEVWPPLLDGLRDTANMLEAALARIEDTLSRVEV